MLYALSIYILLDDSLYLDFWDEKLPYDRILQVIKDTKKWQWVPYLFIPIFTVLKCFLIACCFYLGGFFVKQSIGLGVFFKIVTLAEFTSVLPILSKIVWFGLIQRNYDLEDISYFAPFSAYGYFRRGDLDAWFVYPLQLLNLYEMLYWGVLAVLLREPLKRDFTGSLGFVASTYGVGLLLWVIFVMFLTVSLT